MLLYSFPSDLVKLPEEDYQSVIERTKNTICRLYCEKSKIYHCIFSCILMSFHSHFDEIGAEVGRFGLDVAPLPNSTQRVYYRKGYHKMKKCVVSEFTYKFCYATIYKLQTKTSTTIQCCHLPLQLYVQPTPNTVKLCFETW